MNEKSTSFVLTVILGSICCFLVGIIFFGLQVFNTADASFQFIAFGLICSIFYSTLKFSKIRNAIYLYALMIYLHEILFMYSKTSFVVRDVVFFLSMGIAVYLFCRYFEPKMDKLKFGKFLTVAALFSIGYLVATLLLRLIFQPVQFTQQLFTNISFGLLIGIGLGIGFELADKINMYWLKSTESV